MKNYIVLSVINKYPGINQRKISKESEISLGKINSLIEELENKKLISKEVNGKEYKYYITESGLLFLEKELSSKQNTKLSLHCGEKKKISKAIILAAGKNKNFDIPVCMLKINGEYLIHRTINLLKRNGIKDITVVLGYQKELVKEILSNEINVVFNDDFKWTGTMASLAKTECMVQDDFLLIESDIVIEDAGVVGVLENSNRDCTLITLESGSGDEAYVEIQNNRIYKISKDITQMNKIDGEMLGVSKISLEFYKKMLEKYSDNRNPYVNYEYIMLDVSRQYTLGYAKIDNLLWFEIDNKMHLKYVEEKLVNKIHKKEASLMIDNIKDIIAEVMNVEKSKVSKIEAIGGMTNNNYKILVDDEYYVLRVPGKGTEEMISRNDETKSALFASKIGIDAEIVYFDEKTGLKIAKFIKNAETLTPDSAKKYQSMKLVTDVLRKLHQSNEKMESVFDIYKKIEKYENLLYKYDAYNFDDYQEVKEKVISIKKITNSMDIKLTPCHNDLVAENFIRSGEDKLYLIDWEYGGMNDPMWDLAAYLLENGLTEDDEELFLKLYFNGKPSEQEKRRILINKIYQDFLWSIWTNIKEAKGDNFGTYGIDRYNRAKENLEKLFGERI